MPPGCANEARMPPDTTPQAPRTRAAGSALPLQFCPSTVTVPQRLTSPGSACSEGLVHMCGASSQPQPEAQSSAHGMASPCVNAWVHPLLSPGWAPAWALGVVRPGLRPGGLAGLLDRCPGGGDRGGDTQWLMQRGCRDLCGARPEGRACLEGASSLPS